MRDRRPFETDVAGENGLADDAGVAERAEHDPGAERPAGAARTSSNDSRTDLAVKTSWRPNGSCIR